MAGISPWKTRGNTGEREGIMPKKPDVFKTSIALPEALRRRYFALRAKGFVVPMIKVIEEGLELRLAQIERAIKERGEI